MKRMIVNVKICNLSYYDFELINLYRFLIGKGYYTFHYSEDLEITEGS